MKTTFTHLLLALMIGAATPLAQAAGEGGLLLHGPAEDFNDDDLKQYLGAMTKALDAPGDPQPIEWRNEKTGAGGSFLVVGPATVKGMDGCRRIRGSIYSKKRKGGAQVWAMCKDPSGRWRAVTAG